MSERDGKKPVLERIKNSIFRGDDFDTFVVSTFEDKVMPAIGDALEDLACCTIRAIFNDDDYYDDRKRRDRKRNKSGRKDYTQYSEKKKRRRDRDDDDDDDSSRSLPSDLGPRATDEVLFEDRDEAYDAIGYLCKKCKNNGAVTVADFYSHMNVASTNFTNSDWGWTDVKALGKSEVSRAKGTQKYYISFPEVEAITMDDYYDEE